MAIDKKLIDRLKKHSSRILISCSFMGLSNDRIQLKNIATSIDDLYDTYAEIMKNVKGESL